MDRKREKSRHPHRGVVTASQSEKGEPGLNSIRSIFLFGCPVRKSWINWLGTVVLAAASPSAVAQVAEWPSKPIRIIVAFPPGSPGDFTSRLIAEKLGPALKQPVVVDNRPGASGNVGAEFVINSAPDGYTILEGPDTILTVNPHIFGKLNFKVEALVPLTYMAGFSQMLVCNPSTGVRTLADLVAASKKQDMNYASGGPGVPGHLAMELYSATSGLKMTHVPYKGPSPATQDVLGGQVPCGFLASPVVAPHVKAGKLTAIAVSGTKRSLLAPQVPTMAEAGVKGYDASFGEVLFMRKDTPEPIMRRMNEEIRKILMLPDVREKLNSNDLDPIGDSAADAAQRIAVASEKWGKVVKRINLRVD